VRVSRRVKQNLSFVISPSENSTNHCATPTAPEAGQPKGRSEAEEQQEVMIPTKPSQTEPYGSFVSDRFGSLA